MSESRRKRRRRSSSTPQFPAARTWFRRPDSWTLFAVDVVIVFLIVLFPFIMGGREAWGHLALISGALLLGGLWCLHRVMTGGRLILTGAEILVFGGFAILWLQTAPLSPEQLQQASPEYQRLLEGWPQTQPGSGADSPPVWNTLSLMPVETRHAVWVLLAYAVIGLVLAQRIQSEADAERMLKLVGLSGAAMAAFASVQFICSNDRFFWFYRNPYTGTDEVLKGAFTNRNHFAQFLTVSLGPLLWWLSSLRKPGSASFNRTSHGSSGESMFDRVASVPLLLVLCASGGVLVCVMLSLSRGGMVAAAIVSLVCLGILARQRAFQASVPMILLLLGGLAIGGLLVFGSRGVETRVNQLASADADHIDQMNCRRAIWAADMAAIQQFPIFGTGVGSHRDVYPIYMTDLADFSEFEFTHAESTWIHLAMETGYAGSGLLALGLLLFAARIARALLRSKRDCRRDCLAPVVAVLLAGTLHAVVDFIWYVPAIVMTTLAVLVTGIRVVSGYSSSRGVVTPRFAWLAGGIACVAALIGVQPHLWQRVQGERWWHEYLVATFDEANQAAKRARANDVELINDSGRIYAAGSSIAAKQDSPEQKAARKAEREAAAIRSMKYRIGLLMRSIKANPHQPRAQIRLASLCLKLFDRMQQTAENPLSLAEVRDTALTAGFESSQQLQEWLERAFGRNIRLAATADRMARDALRYSPVQGPAYLTLLETGFLRDPTDPQHDLLLKSALTIRGHDPRTRFIAGQSAMYAGDTARAMHHWAIVFHANQEFRESITWVLAKVMPASRLMIEFQPSVVELREVLAAYGEQGRQPEIDQILHEAVRLTEQANDDVTTEDRVALLMDGYRVAWQHKRAEVAEDMLRRAIAFDELAYWPRHALGLLLYETQRFDEASETFAWCYRQQPGDTQLEKLIRESRTKARQQQMRVMQTSWPRP